MAIFESLRERVLFRSGFSGRERQVRKENFSKSFLGALCELIRCSYSFVTACWGNGGQNLIYLHLP